MINILDKICENKKNEIINSKEKCSFSSLEKLYKESQNRNFLNLIINSQKESKNNIIGEIKKSSPSAGEIIKDYVPENIAKEYENAGIGALSVLTDKNFFDGNLDHISIIHNNSNLPILRKDFIIDPYQILESKIYKADAILLILSILDDNEVKNFIKIAESYNLDCLIETHNEEEILRAINIGYPIIGINNRNLKDLSVNMNNKFKLIKKIPKDFTIIAESGIKTKDDISRYNDLGIFNFLIGESILKSINIKNKIKELLS